MDKLYQQALAAMPVEDVTFILSQLPEVREGSPQLQHESAPAPGCGTEEDEDGRRRRHIEREWPEVGAILSSDYFGVTYTAEIIPASKKLKSGKQIRITSGPAQGVVCDSVSEAMVVATEKQRTEQNLGRKGASNGWCFWRWDGKPEDVSGNADDETSID